MIYYRPATVEDVNNICMMRWADSTRLQIRDARQYTEANCRRWISNMGGSSERLSVFDDGRFVGLIRLDNIDDVNGNCCVGLDIIEEERGKGLAKATYQKLLDELFFQRRMECVWLEVLETNTVAVELYKKLGFTIDGKLRSRVFRNGLYLDCLTMSILRSEWR